MAKTEKSLESKLTYEEKKELSAQIGDTEEPSKTLRESLSFVISTGLPLPKLDKIDVDSIKFPSASELVSMTNEQVTAMMAEWTHLLNFANFELAKHEIERTAKQNKYDRERKKMIKRLREGNPEKGIEGLSEARAKDEADLDENLGKLIYQLELAKAKYMLVEKLYKNYSQNYRMLSRELARRGIISEAEWKTSK